MQLWIGRSTSLPLMLRRTSDVGGRLRGRNNKPVTAASLDTSLRPSRDNLETSF